MLKNRKNVHYLVKECATFSSKSLLLINLSCHMTLKIIIYICTSTTLFETCDTSYGFSNLNMQCTHQFFNALRTLIHVCFHSAQFTEETHNTKHFCLLTFEWVLFISLLALFNTFKLETIPRPPRSFLTGHQVIASLDASITDKNDAEPRTEQAPCSASRLRNHPPTGNHKTQSGCHCMLKKKFICHNTK